MSNNITKQNTDRLELYSHQEIGDDHMYTGLETPLKKDAFAVSDAEKKAKIVCRRGLAFGGFYSKSLKKKKKEKRKRGVVRFEFGF